MTTIYKKIDDNAIQFFTTNDDGSTTNGPIVKGRTRTRQVQTGTQEVESGSEQVENGTQEIEVGTISVEVGTEEVEDGIISVKIGEDDEGNPIFEDKIQYITVPIFEDQMQYETVPTFETVITYITEPVFETETYSPWDELMLTDPTIEPIPQAVIDAELVEAFKRERQTLIAKAVVTTEAGNQYDADETSVIRLGGAITRYAGKAGTTKVFWSLADTATGFMSEVTLADLKEAHALAVDNITAIWGS
jgi:hypothetical protein